MDYLTLDETGDMEERKEGRKKEGRKEREGKGKEKERREGGKEGKGETFCF